MLVALNYSIKMPEDMVGERRRPRGYASFLRTMKSAIAQKQARPNKTLACPHTIFLLNADLGVADLTVTVGLEDVRENPATTFRPKSANDATRCRKRKLLRKLRRKKYGRSYL